MKIYDALERLDLFRGVWGIEPTHEGFVILLGGGAPLGMAVRLCTPDAADFGEVARRSGFEVVLRPAVHLIRAEV